MSKIKCSLRAGVYYQVEFTVQFVGPNLFTLWHFLSTQTSRNPGTCYVLRTVFAFQRYVELIQEGEEDDQLLGYERLFTII